MLKKIRCRQATRLLSDDQERPLAWQERLPLWMHLRICPGCRNFKVQLRFLREASQNYTDETGQSAP